MNCDVGVRSSLAASAGWAWLDSVTFSRGSFIVVARGPRRSVTGKDSTRNGREHLSRSTVLCSVGEAGALLIITAAK